MPRTTFTTPLGTCAIAWGKKGLTAFALPEAEARANDVSPDAVHDEITMLIARVRRHLADEPQDFSDARYDFSGLGQFSAHVLRATLEVKSGHTASYGEIAAALGQRPAVSRAVGAALRANAWPLLIPCHRITGAGGRMTGFSGPGGVATKVKLLALEGAQLFAE